MLNQKRLERVNENLEKIGLKQTIITDVMAVYYLVGKKLFSGERFLGFLVGSGVKPVLIVNELNRFEEDLGVPVQYYKDGDPLVPIFADKVLHDEVLGVDKNMAAHFLLELMEGNIVKGFANGSLAVDHTRAIKDEEEKEKMRRSSRINDLAMAKFKELIHEGVTEREVASRMPGIYKALGAERQAFAIVAFGENSADPHHIPDDTVIKEGDTVLFDVGCVFEDYNSDMTRTFFYKKYPEPEAERIYNLVKDANEAAEAMLKVGVSLKDVDSAARDIITEGGYGPDFTHRLGHFIGLEVHEYGDVSQANPNLTEAGNIFSIEPGIYHRAIAGVRIEDLVIVTEDGCEVLNSFPKDIEVIG